MPITHHYVATGTNDPAKQVSVDRWNEGHEITGELIFPEAAPAAPPANNVALFAKKLASRMMTMQKGPSGLETSLQPHLGGNKVALWMPPGGSTTAPAIFGMAALTGTGTASARSFTTANMIGRMSRLGYASAATAASLAGAREAVAKYTTGAGAGLGGFFARYRFGVSDASYIAGARMFVGLSASTAAPSNVEPNTLLNSIGIVALSTSDNLHIYGAAASVGTPIDLGANFPATTGAGNVYELAMFSPIAGGAFWQVTRLNTGDVAAGEFATPPLGTTLLCHQIWRSNNATALAVGIDICGIYIETDY